MTTMASFYSTLSDLSVTGVNNLDNPPVFNDLSTANIPCKWVDSLTVEDGPLIARDVGGDRTLRARVVVVTDAIGQDRHAQRWSAARTMSDTLETALQTLTGVYQRISYTVEVDPALWDGWYAVTAAIELEDL